MRDVTKEGTKGITSESWQGDREEQKGENDKEQPFFRLFDTERLVRCCCDNGRSRAPHLHALGFPCDPHGNEQPTSWTYLIMVGSTHPPSWVQHSSTMLVLTHTFLTIIFSFFFFFSLSLSRWRQWNHEFFVQFLGVNEPCKQLQECFSKFLEGCPERFASDCQTRLENCKNLRVH